jgi:membrane-bound metal-dependent hydrolase YbcI (DUF457 family)
MLAGAATAWAADLFPGDRAWRVVPPSAGWFERAGGTLTLACAVLAAAPDLDLLFHSHRTVTHSIGAAAFVALFAGAMAANASLPIARVASMCCGAYLTHLLLDWLGADATPPYGIQALWPLGDGWYISNLNIFRQTARRFFFTAPIILQNAAAIVQEIAILAPLTWAIWLVRVKALAGLPPELSGGDHPAEQRAGAILGIAEPFEHHVENRQADVEAD